MTDSPLVRRALRLSVWDGIFANLYANLTGGVQVGLLAAFPLVANVAQVFSTYLIELIGRRRPLALLGGTVRSADLAHGDSCAVLYLFAALPPLSQHVGDCPLANRHGDQ